MPAKIGKRSLSLAAGIFIGLSSGATGVYASPITFDPDGLNTHTSSSNPALSVSAFDFLPGNTLLKGALTSALSVGQSLPVDVYFQSSVANLVDNSSAIAVNGFSPVPTGGQEFELTALARFQATITRTPDFLGNQRYDIKLVTGGANFFEIYYDENTSTFANNLAGTGFNDGTRILSGTVSPTGASKIGSFTVNSSSTQIFDQFLNDDYFPITSYQMSGTLDFTATVNTLDSDFFHDGINLVTVDTATNLNTPFTHVDPSEKFSGNLNGNNPSLVTPIIGTTNGLTGPDIQLEASHPTASFGVVPEPSTVIATLFGAASIGLRRRKLPHRPA